jgi:hypothetical protein
MSNDYHSKIWDKANIAILVRRLLLQFQLEPEAVGSTERELVAGDMQVAYSVPAHGEYLRSGARSEPILAEAAASIMCWNMGLCEHAQCATLAIATPLLFLTHAYPFVHCPIV